MRPRPVEEGQPAGGREGVDAEAVVVGWEGNGPGTLGFSLFWLYGLRLTTTSAGGIAASTAPAAIALLSFVLLRERLRGPQLVGIALAVGGVAAMTAVAAGGEGEGAPNPALGNLLIGGAVVCEALFVVLGKRAGVRVGPLAITTAVTVFGFLLFLPLAVVEAASIESAAVPVGAWLAVIAYALGPTVLGYLLVYRALARVPASVAAAFTGVVPVSAVLLSALVLGEPVGAAHVVGVAGVLAAIGLMVGGERDSA